MNKTFFRGDPSRAAPSRNYQGSFRKRPSRQWACWLVVGATALAGCANLSTQMLPFRAKTNDTESKLAYARLMEKHGQTSQAEQLYEAMIKQDQRQQVAYQRLGVLAAKRGQYKEAEDHFQRAARVAPMTAELYNDIGYNYYLQDRLEDAEKAYRQALDRNPQYVSAHNNLGLVLGQQGHYEESLAEFLHGGPEAHAYTNLAYIYAQNHDLTHAKQYFSRALDLDHSLRPAAEGLIQLATITGEVPPSRNPASKNAPQVAGRNQPSSPAGMHKVSHPQRPPKTPADGQPTLAKSGSTEKTPPGEAEVAAGATKAEGDKAHAPPTILPTNVEPFSWKQPQQSSANTKPTAKGFADANTKKPRSADDLIQEWRDRGKNSGKPVAGARPASPRSIEVSVEDQPVRRRGQTQNKSNPGTARPPSAAQLSAVRQMPAAGKASPSQAVTKPLPSGEAPAAQQDPNLVPASAVAVASRIAPPRAVRSVWLDRRVARWTARPTSQSARIEAMVAASRAQAPADTTAATEPARPAPRNGAPNRNWAGRAPIVKSGQKPGLPNNAPPNATPVAKTTDKMPVPAVAAVSQPPLPLEEAVAPATQNDPKVQNAATPVTSVALEQPRSTDPALRSSRKPRGSPGNVPQKPRLAPSMPTLPRLVSNAADMPATPTNDRASQAGMAALRPQISQLSQDVSAPPSTNLQVQPQVITMPTTLIRRMDESLAATNAAPSQPTSAAAQAPQAMPQDGGKSVLPVLLAGATQPQSQPPLPPDAPVAAPSEQSAIAPPADALPQPEPEPPPATPQQLVDRAATEFEHFEFGHSLASYGAALQQSPSYMPALVGRAKLYRKLGRFEESLADSTRLIRTFPENGEGFLERGLTRAAMGLVPEAAADFDMAVRLDATSAAARLERGKMHMMMRQFGAALADYNEVVRLAPGMPRGYIERARVQRLLHQPEDALDDYTAAIQLEGQSVDGLLERALLYLELDKVQKSLADLNAAIERAPGDARIYVARARLNRHERAWREAQDDLDAAVRLDPASKPARVEREALLNEMPRQGQKTASGS